MNTRTKAELKGLIAGLEVIYKGELKAHKKHKSAGEETYAKHAAWCADGIQEALMLFENKFPAEAITLLRSIVASAPSDDLKAHTGTKPEPSKAGLPAQCTDGSCNHPEHL